MMNLKFSKIGLSIIVILSCSHRLWPAVLNGDQKNSLIHSKKDAHNAMADFEVTTQIPFLTIIEKSVRLIADKEITIKDLESLRQFDIYLFDENSLEELKKEKNKLDLDAGSQLDEIRKQNPQLDSAHYEYHKETFRRLIEDKRRVLGYDRAFPVRIMSPPGSGEQAVALLNFIVDEMKIPSDSVTIIFTKGPNSSARAKNAAVLELLKVSGVDTTFRKKRVGIGLDPEVNLSDDQTIFLLIRRSKATESVSHWRLIIQQYNKQIKLIEGKEDVDKITWDWKNKEGKLIEPGEYLYYFQWKESASDDWKPEKPRKKLILVTKHTHEQRIFLTKDGHPKYLEDIKSISTQEPMKIEILLKTREND